MLNLFNNNAETITQFLRLSFFGNPVHRWLTGSALFLFSYLALKIVRSIARKTVAKNASRTVTQMDDWVVLLIEKTRSWFLFATSSFLALQIIHLEPKIDTLSEKTIVLFFLAQIIVWANHSLDFWVKLRLSHESHASPAKHTTLGFIALAIRVSVYALISLVGLHNLGFNITALIAGLGVGGIAIALAVQNILGDLFASLTIVLDKPFEVGDSISVGDITGTIEKIGLKTTRLRAGSGEQIIFSNGDLLHSRIRNTSRLREKRVVFQTLLATHTPSQKLSEVPELIKRSVLGAAGLPTFTHFSVSFERSHLSSLTDLGANFETSYVVTSSVAIDQLNLHQSVLLLLAEKLENSGIKLASRSANLASYEK